MSLKRKEDIQCPKCGKTNEYTFWASINTETDPEMKEQVKSGEAFIFTCPDCGAKMMINADMLYHDRENRLLIHYCASEESYYEVSKMLNGEFDQSAEDEEILQKILTANEMDSYIKRIVTTQNQIREKIVIFEAGLDDRVIEFAKAMVMTNLMKDVEGMDFEEVLFNIQPDGSYAFEIINTKESLGIVPFKKELYDDCKAKFGSTLCDIRRDEFTINLEWVLRKVQSQHGGPVS